MSSASLASSHTLPDRQRIAAISIAISVNLIVFVIASRPITADPLKAVQDPHPTPLLRWIEPPPAVQPPPAIALKPLPHPVSATRTPAAPVVHPSVASPVSTPAIVQTPAPALTPARPESQTTAATHTAPTAASLAYRSAPLSFPLAALRQHLQGTVLLQVLVGEQGQPLAVKVEHSSGYPMLDRSARQQVLARWRFHPAVINGHAVQAWACVPVTFALNPQ